MNTGYLICSCGACCRRPYGLGIGSGIKNAHPLLDRRFSCVLFNTLIYYNAEHLGFTLGLQEENVRSK